MSIDYARLVAHDRVHGTLYTDPQVFDDEIDRIFGSGWVWLVKSGDKVELKKTPNAETPVAEGGKALLVVDVWEHAYYLDYQNRRKDFVEAVLKGLLNWDFANENWGA